MAYRTGFPGERYGILTVVGEGEMSGKNRRLICRCDCGNEVSVLIGNLKTGGVYSCGCANKRKRSSGSAPRKRGVRGGPRGRPREDLTTRRFGFLTVISFFGAQKSSQSLWTCKCDCGAITIVSAGSLKRGHTKSCGHKKIKHCLMCGEKLVGGRFGFYCSDTCRTLSNRGGSLPKSVQSYGILNRTCLECSQRFHGGPRAYYCPACREDRKRQAKVRYQARKRSGDVRPIGSVDTCERCGSVYTVEGGLQRFCPDCQPIHAAEHDRETALPFYHANKERLNYSRNIKRRKTDPYCLICGKWFEPKNGSTTCSPECKAEIGRRRNREWYARERAKERGDTVSQADLARVLGVSRAAIGDRVRRGTLPPFDEGKAWKQETINPFMNAKNPSST